MRTSILRPCMQQTGLFLSVSVCVGCSSLPHHSVRITDTRGKAIFEAAVSPYPVSILPFGPGSRGNLTNEQGRIEIYDVVPGNDYELSAVGFRTRRIPFPERDGAVYSLETTKKLVVQ